MLVVVLTRKLRKGGIKLNQEYIEGKGEGWCFRMLHIPYCLMLRISRTYMAKLIQSPKSRFARMREIGKRNERFAGKSGTEVR